MNLLPMSMIPYGVTVSNYMPKPMLIESQFRVILLAGGQSQHNDSQGISATLLFSHLPPRHESAGKTRKNAKLPTTTKVFAFHEDMNLRDFLACTLDSLVPSRNDLLGKCKLWLDPTGSDLPPETATSVTVKYTIPRSAYQDVLVKSEKDFKETMRVLVSKSALTVKISMQKHALPVRSSVVI